MFPMPLLFRFMPRVIIFIKLEAKTHKAFHSHGFRPFVEALLVSRYGIPGFNCYESSPR